MHEIIMFVVKMLESPRTRSYSALNASNQLPYLTFPASLSLSVCEKRVHHQQHMAHLLPFSASTVLVTCSG